MASRLGVAFFLLSGCTNDLVLSGRDVDGSTKPQDHVDASDDGLVIVEDLDNFSLEGTYQRDGRTVRFQTRRGVPIPTEEAGPVDPDAPAYEYDIRFLDELGATFYLQLGGHDFIDPSWALVEADFEAPDIQERSLAFELAREATLALDDRDLSPEFDVETSALTDLHRTSFGPEDNPEEDLGAPPPPSSTYRHYIYIRKKSAFFDGSPADHSALWVKVYVGSKKVSETSTSNHGTTASSSTMSTKCSTYVDYSKLIYVPENVCTTGYGLTYGFHVCNDDTYVQYDESSNVYSSTRSECSDWPDYWATSCF